MNYVKLLVTLSFFFLLACQSAINKAARETKYSAYELIGIQKRDLFKKEVVNVKEDQEDAGKSFKNALDRLKEVYNFDGGNLEKKYRALNTAYDSAEKDAGNVHLRVAKIETVAQDLFSEWRKEISEITTPSLRQKSAATLDDTQKKYRDFYSSLKKSESKMTPVLAKFKDQVLFLKHNLNAQAITGLKGESSKIEGDIESLIKDMNTSISQAEDFIKSM
jgi:hypothetical protein